jgi:hypothetical protein
MKAKRFLSSTLLLMLCLSTLNQQAQAQQPVSQSSQTDNPADIFRGAILTNFLARSWHRKKTSLSREPANRYTNAGNGGFTLNGFTLAPMAAPAVHGIGTVGKISLWVDTQPSGNSILGDSIITQLNDNIGIGIVSPTSKLSVQGMIETTLGGYKFPDGTVQTTAAISGLQAVSHDTTLTGDGTAGAPLGLALPLVLSGSAPTSALLSVTNTDTNIFASGVRSFSQNGYGVQGTSFTLNGVFGVSVESDGVLGQSSASGVFAGGVRGFCQVCSGVVGQSAGGNGVSGRGQVGVYGEGNASNDSGGSGIKALGGASQFGTGGIGVEAVGGFSPTQGGKGLVVMGGESFRTVGGNNAGGTGIFVVGGSARSTNLEGDTAGGDGLVVKGGDSSGTLSGGSFPGSGVNATGGTNALGPGGVGVFATGGLSRDGNGNVGLGGIGLVATGGGGNPVGRAGLFRGDVEIQGNLDVSGAKHFKIDHPLDPENKYLLHASIESSEVLNVYSGNVVTDAKGDAVVILPDWFEALNRDLRYQLTVIGTFAQAMVANEMQNNRFAIKTSAPNVKVSWQVTGVRSDKAMQKQPFKAEERKPAPERGHYLQPELYNQPEERSIEWPRHPELMKQLRQQEVEPRRVAKQQPKDR